MSFEQKWAADLKLTAMMAQIRIRKLLLLGESGIGPRAGSDMSPFPIPTRTDNATGISRPELSVLTNSGVHNLCESAANVFPTVTLLKNVVSKGH
jgi:hypothetical protein